MDPTASTPWCDANTVGPPLIRFLEERRNDGENFIEWILTLRALNKSWCLEVSSHIQKVSVTGDRQLKHLHKSLQGSLARVKNLTVNEIWQQGCRSVRIPGYEGLGTSSMICDVLNSGVNVQTLSLDHVRETEFGNLIPMTSVKHLSIKQTSLAIVEKCPNLENLIIVDCSMKKTKFRCNPRLRSLSIDSWEDFWSLSLDESFLNGLASLTELTQLRISRRLFGKSFVFGLPGLEKIRSVQSRRDDEFKRGFLNALPPSLRELEVWGLLSWADNRLLMEKTTSLNSLEKLELGNGDGRVGYDALQWLTKLPNLVELSLWGRDLGAQGIVRLSEMPKLRRLALNVVSINLEAFLQLCSVGDNVQQIMVCCQKEDFKTDSVVVREAERLLEARGVAVKLVCKD